MIKATIFLDLVTYSLESMISCDVPEVLEFGEKEDMDGFCLIDENEEIIPPTPQCNFEGFPPVYTFVNADKFLPKYAVDLHGQLDEYDVPNKLIIKRDQEGWSEESLLYDKELKKVLTHIAIIINKSLSN